MDMDMGMNMDMQRPHGEDNNNYYYWNRQSDWGFCTESDYSSANLMQPLSGRRGGGDGLSVGGGGLGYIEHTVTKFDTLAGVAIKYGVEVADIKRMNGLTTDLQMYSRKTLYIPLPGRHPPSPVISNGYDLQGPKKHTTPPNHRHSDLCDSIKSLKLSASSPQTVSPSMDALRDYYGLKPTNQNGTNGRLRPDSYQKAGSYNIENGPKPPQSSHPPLGLHRKCKSLANGLSEGAASNGPVSNGKKPDSSTWYDKLMRRRLSEVDLQTHTPEMLLKPDTTNTASAFSAAAGKGLALRPKAASKTASDSDTDASGVKKSSSSPSFYDSYNNSSNGNSNSNNNNNNGSSISSIWPTSVLNLTVDALSTAAITRPIFDGLPKPISGRKNKAAID